MTEGNRVPEPASPGRAALLSFMLPGLGQIALGSFQRGLVLAAPIVVTIAAALFFIMADRADLISGLFDPTVILALIVLDLLLGLIHLLAIGDAHALARRRVVDGAATRRAGSTRLLVLLLAAALALHGAIAAVGVQAYDAFATVFTAPATGYTIPLPSFAAAGRGTSGAPAPTAFAGGPLPGPAWAADGRLNVLLVGGDAGPRRWSLRTDTMILLSADLATGRVALFGIPRNLVGAPLAPEDAGLAPGGRFPGLLNALWVEADTHPNDYPGTDGTRGFRAISGAIQQLVGVPLDGAVVVNLNGFVDLVDALGGVWINVQYPIHDDAYPLENGTGDIVLNIRAGCQHFGGHLALAYARSRHQSSDYARMARQQAVLEDLARQLDPISLIMQVPDLIEIAGDNVRTTFQPQDMGQLLRFADRVDRAHATSILFSPPEYPEFLTTAEIARIQKTVRDVFASPISPSASASAAPTATPAAAACPRG